MRFAELGPSTTASVFSRVEKRAGSSRAAGVFASAAAAANTAHAIARRRRRVAPDRGKYRTSERLDVMAGASRSGRRRRRTFAAFAAEVGNGEQQRRGLERGAEVERRTDAPVAPGQVRHRGQE